ncbi:MoaE protein [Phytophthora infestans]|uniref:Molybdopterin synthase catalytic subunit n=1 Tax=Phytophthora infestans TaxID=4787 RepID=A0A833TMH0_PHYIN|nr:MoaE protein [Phytophthora infestans]
MADMNTTMTSHTSPEAGVGDFVEVGFEPLDNQRAVALVTHSSAGAISTFVGTTRDNFQVRLEYEGYTPMAVSELRKICVIIREKWPDVVGVALFHRLGVVEVAEASVIVVVSSPHRREALEACAFAIDTLKATVPIWKCEQYEGDTRMWKENVEWKDGAAARSSCCGNKRVMVPIEHK